MRRLLIAASLAATLTLGTMITAPVFADSDPTMDQIYSAAAGGHLDQAQQMITQVLADHPSSAKAHYVQAELYAREGKASLARSELSTAEQLKPGLPFANPRSVQELKAQLGIRTGVAGPQVLRSEHAAARFPWGTLLVLAGAVFLLMRVFRRRPPYSQYPVSGPGVGGAPMGGAPGSYGPGYGPGPMGGGGIGSGIAGGLASGLAVGAGVVAGEELAHHFLDGGGHGGGGIIPPAEAGESGSGNGDMGGADFGVNDPGSGWDDGGFGGGDSGGGDWS